MSVRCGVCATILSWPADQEEPVPCPTCERRKFMEDRLLENMEVMKSILTCLKEIVTILGSKSHGEKEG